MVKPNKRALEDNDRNAVTLSSKRRRQGPASNPTTAMPTSNPSIAPSPPTLLNSPAPTTPHRRLHPSTPSYSSSPTGSTASATSSDVSSSCSDSTNSLSTSSAASRPHQPRSHLPYLVLRPLSPSTTNSGTSTTDTGSYTTSASGSLPSPSSDSDSDSDSLSSPSSETSSSALSSSSSTHAAQQPHQPVLTSLTAANLSHLQSRLNALLPKMRRANAVLEVEREEGRLGERDIENVAQGGYIEMDLGLGVLEGKTRDGVREGGDGGEGSEGGMGGGERVGGGDVLADMMGQGRGWRKGKGECGIEEVRR